MLNVLLLIVKNLRERNKSKYGRGCSKSSTAPCLGSRVLEAPKNSVCIIRDFKIILCEKFYSEVLKVKLTTCVLALVQLFLLCPIGFLFCCLLKVRT